MSDVRECDRDGCGFIADAAGYRWWTVEPPDFLQSVSDLKDDLHFCNLRHLGEWATKEANQRGEP